MATTATVRNLDPHHTSANLYVIHPLDDVQEQKCSTEGLGPMELTPTVRYSLLVLRLYLVAMTLIVLYRTLTLANVLGNHAH